MLVIEIIAFAGCLACAIWTTCMVDRLRADLAELGESQTKLNALSEQLAANAKKLHVALTPGPADL